MKRLILLAAVFFSLVGCQHTRVSHYLKKNLIGVSGQQTKLLMIVPNDQSNSAWEEWEEVSIDEGAIAAIEKHCIKRTIEATGLAIAAPVFASAGKLFFDLYMEKRAVDLKALKKRAQQTYSDTIFLPTEDFQRCECAVLSRYGKTDAETHPGLIAVVKLKKYETTVKTDSFTIQPVYLKAFNSMALTAGREPKNSKKGKGGKVSDLEYPMNVSIGFAVKTIGMQESELPGLFSVGEGSVSVPNLKIGPEAESFGCSNDCPTSDLMPLLGSGGKTLSVSMSVTETGDVGIDFDRKEAEIAAIKEALGPAVSSAITKALE